MRDEEILRASAWYVWTVAKNKADGEQNGCVCCGEEELVWTFLRGKLASQICRAESLSV